MRTEIRIVAVCGRPPQWAADAESEYLRRMGRLKVSVAEVRPASKAGTRREARRREAGRIARHLDGGPEVIALDERGEMPDTEGLARLVREAPGGRPAIAFVIGGAEGLDDSVRRRAGRVLSLSRLTLPHALARVVLVEQLYRVDTLLRGHPYHRGRAA